MAEFNLETERLVIRNWCDEDRALFHEINSDEQVMAFFPFRRTRKESDAMMDRLKAGIEKDGFGFAALALKETNQAIGFCGLADAAQEDGFEGAVEKTEIEIGWRLATRFWGKGYVTEAAGRLLRFGFEEMRLPQIVAFAVSDNKRSFAVMERIGMTRDPARDFDHVRVPDSHPHLKRHLTYIIYNPANGTN